MLGGNLPSVQVSDLQYQPRDHVIVISTYGRGMWALDATRMTTGKVGACFPRIEPTARHV